MNQANSHPLQKLSPLAVTGIGVYTPMGKTPKEFWERINAGECSVREIQGFATDGLRVRHASEVVDHIPTNYFTEPEYLELDWTAQFGIIAARQAVIDANLPGDLSSSSKLGLVVGVCAGGQGISPLQRSPDKPFEIALDKFPDTSLYRQTDAIGLALGIHGPRSTISTACASSGSALGYAYELLQADQAEAVLVGGTDAFSISTYAGFYALGAMPEQPISPFSENLGVSFGEGAGFVVLEPLEKAQARGAKIYGLMLGYGCTGDAHHVTAPHPSGEGLQRAMSAALERAGLQAASIDYINAHGTATRDNDRAETSAIRELFQPHGKVPPVSSSKSQFGHTLGAAGVLEFIVSILAQREQCIPPTVNFVSPRPGCDLDYVPNESRAGKIDAFLSNSAAFGGINVSVVGGSLAHDHAGREITQDDIWITGFGVVSPIGCGADEFHMGLREGRSGLLPISEFDASHCRSKHAALMGDFKARKLAPTIDVRRTDPLNRYAMVAAALALKHSKLEVKPTNSTRVGMIMSLNYGSIAVQERFRDSLENDGLEKLSAKHFPSMVVSTVGGTVAQSFGFRGYNATIADGITSGLQGLIHAALVLAHDDSQDAIVVIAADEVAQLLFKTFDQKHWLADTNGSVTGDLAPYQRHGRGMLLGEGGVALVLERGHKARERGATLWGKLAGYGMAADASLKPQVITDTRWQLAAMHQALRSAACTPDQIDLVYGHGRGEPQHDERELLGLKQLFAERPVPIGCVLGNTGVAAAASGLYSVAAALLSLKYGEAFPIVGSGDAPLVDSNLVRASLQSQFRRVMVTGSTENGNHNALVLTTEEASQ